MGGGDHRFDAIDVDVIANDLGEAVEGGFTRFMFGVGGGRRGRLSRGARVSQALEEGHAQGVVVEEAVAVGAGDAAVGGEGTVVVGGALRVDGGAIGGAAVEAEEGVERGAVDGGGAAHVDFVASDGAGGRRRPGSGARDDGAVHLLGAFGFVEVRLDGKEGETVDADSGRALDAGFVDQGAAEHLAAAADTDDGAGGGGVLLDGVGETSLPEEGEIGDGGFGAGEDQAVGLPNWAGSST